MIASKISQWILLTLIMIFVISCPPKKVIIVPPDYTTDLVAYYPFNGNANDESGNGNHGTVKNGANLTNDRFGMANRAYAFDGTDDYIEVPDSPNFNFNYPITLTAWIYLDDNANGGVVGQWGHGGLPGDAFILYINDAQLSTFVPQSGDPGHYLLQGNTRLTTDKWIFISMVSDGNSVKLFVNSSLDAAANISLAQVDSTRALKIGVEEIFFGTNNYFDGRLDEIRIYKSALSQAKIKQIMNEGGASTDIDTDGDCYTDDWEIKHGYDILDPDDPPDHDKDCMTDKQEKVTDTDGDGINDFWDNCENNPNATVGGVVKGTCLQGSVGLSCTDNTDCGTGGVCSANQEDVDADGVGDVCDNCPRVANAKQEDADSDGVGDVCDNAPNDWNSGQEDRDADGVPDVVDNCPADPNEMEPYKRGDSMEWIKDGSPVECALYSDLVAAVGDQWQVDKDCDGIGDVCDGNNSGKKPKAQYDPLTDDTDGDGIVDIDDNCPTVANPNQKNSDCPGPGCDEIGDACDIDDDGDGILDACDADHPDNAGANADTDNIIDSCDADDDGDGILDTCDADHPDNSAASNSDTDNIIDLCDNCDTADNPDQLDVDGNGIGDVCEAPIRIKFELQDLSSSGDSYDDWLPTDSRQAKIIARLYQNGSLVNPQPAIACIIVGNRTSSYPGRYHNDDPDSPDVNPSSPKDPQYNSDPDYQAVSGSGTNTIVIESKDYGGYTVIKAETADGSYTAELKIPRDVDDDGLPDKFESDPILNPSRTLNPLLKDTDSNGVNDTMEDLDISVNAVSKGDGLSAFAEYRGVMWNGQHYRLSPEKKTLFVYGTGFSTAFPLEIGPAFENAGLEVYKTTDASHEKNNLDVLVVSAYPSGYSTADKNTGHIRKYNTRKWDIPVLGESYFAYTDSSGVFNYGQPTRIFVRSIENYFTIDRPYLDRDTLMSATVNKNSVWDPNPNNQLDPIERVEDKDDNGGKNGNEDKNRDGDVNGDKVELNKATWNNPSKLSPFNIDNDAWVELPQDRGNPQTLVPNSMTTGKESTLPEVGRHVVTHEIGHAVGMGVGDAVIVDTEGHCLHDTNCLMFQFSIDWNRDGYFCPYHQSLIQIDNK